MSGAGTATNCFLLTIEGVIKALTLSMLNCILFIVFLDDWNGDTMSNRNFILVGASLFDEECNFYSNPFVVLLLEGSPQHRKRMKQRNSWRDHFFLWNRQIHSILSDRCYSLITLARDWFLWLLIPTTVRAFWCELHGIGKNILNEILLRLRGDVECIKVFQTRGIASKQSSIELTGFTLKHILLLHSWLHGT